MGIGRAKEDRPTPPQVYNWRVYALSICATMGSWMFGYNNAVIGGCMVLPSFQDDFQMPPSDTKSYTNIAANIVSFVQIGAIVGSLLVFPVLKMLGRKIALGLSGVVFFIGAALQTFSAGQLSLLYAGRALSGVGLGFATVSVPMYIGELSPPAIRGQLIGLYEINNQLSALWGFWVNYFTLVGIPDSQSRQWQIPLAMQMIPAGLLCIAAAFILPESPRWLIEHGRSDQARSILAMLRHLDGNDPYICFEIDRAEDARLRQIETRKAKQKLGIDMRWHRRVIAIVRELAWPGNRNRLALGCFLMWAANGTGIMGINSFAPSIFESIGIHGTRRHLLLSGFYSLSRVFTSMLVLFLFIDKAGRRVLLLCATTGIVVSLTYIGIFNTVTVNAVSKGASGVVAIVCIYTFSVSFSIGWNGVPWVYCAEIFPGRIKDMAVCLTTWNQWIAQFLISRLTPYMLRATASGNVLFFFFAGTTLCSGLIVYFFLPETRGHTLEDMDNIFGTPYKGGGQAAAAGVIVEDVANPMVDELVRVPTNV